MNLPPERLPIYGVLTGPTMLHASIGSAIPLKMGYGLHGAPAVAFNEERVIVAQAVIWPASIRLCTKSREPQSPGLGS